MNEIVSNDYKEDLLKDNYKLIYPNDLGLNLTMKNKEAILNSLFFILVILQIHLRVPFSDYNSVQI